MKQPLLSPVSSRLARSAISARLADVHHAIASCERCERLRAYCRRVAREKRRAYADETYWGRPVPGFGDPAARLLIVGLAPAAHGANRTGRVFTGDGRGGSGDFLMTALHAHGFANMTTSQHTGDGLKLSDAYILAAVRCAPPDNRPSPAEIARCQDHFAAEWDELPNVRVVVALGRIAFDACLQLLRRRSVSLAPRPQFAHRAVVPLATGLTLVGSYHPSRQNTNTGRLTPSMLADVFGEARRLLMPASGS
jgi:uracil-DNA glycosylase family 4